MLKQIRVRKYIGKKYISAHKCDWWLNNECLGPVDMDILKQLARTHRFIVIHISQTFITYSFKLKLKNHYAS